MKKKYIIIAFGIILTLFAFKQCQVRRLKNEVQVQKISLSTFVDSLVVFRSQTGELTTKLQSVEVEHSVTKKALEAAGYDIKELRNRDIKWRDVVFALKAELETAGHGTTILRDTIWRNSVDTVRGAVFDWTNKYLTLQGNIKESQMQFNYNYRTSIDLISEKKGKNYVVSAYMSDPQATITQGNSITIVPNKRWWDKWWVYTIVGTSVGIVIAK